jgi:restriction system protein
MAQYQREAERAARAREREDMRAVREAERAQKAYERAAVAEEKERKKLYVESRVAAVDARNAELDAGVQRLGSLLGETLHVDDFFDLDALKVEPQLPVFQPGSLATEAPRPVLDTLLPTPLSFLAKAVPGARAKHEKAIEEARAQYEVAVAEHAASEAERRLRLDAARLSHDDQVARARAAAEEENQLVEDLKAGVAIGAPDALAEYFSLVLDASSYPESFPREHRLAYVPDSQQLVVEMELPPFSVVPAVRQYKYVRARDVVDETPRPATQMRALYTGVVAQVTLRTLHELFEADRRGHVETIVLNGYVATIDPATGKPVRPHLVSVRSTREAFLGLDLEHVEPLACLKGLNAAVSKTPSELIPVRPVLEFDMVDPRFIQESDVLGALDNRPNLMELSPSEFEGLIRDLFEKMGLETKVTQASRDGGVDCVAFDPRPIFGGKVVIQAKRYKNTVGVSAVRDLFGTMQNEGASKGILVTTSGYGAASFDFAAGKPLELLDGTNLLYLLAEHAGVEARIEPPDDWVDPAADIDAAVAAVPREAPAL